MLKLYVMRHAKSSWAAPGARDIDRELNERGLFDLEKLCPVLKKRGYVPDKVLCSPSVRTRQTLDGIISVFPQSVEISFPDRLYSSGLSEYIELIQETNDATALMIIGHNPMCGALAAALPRQDSDYPVDSIAYKYPTATLAVIEFDCENWDKIDKAQGNLVDCIIPGEL